MASVQDDAERDAMRILKTMGWSEALPIDPVAIAKQLGVAAFAAQLDPNVSGLLNKRPGHDPVIILNRDDSENRQRFSCAHELGHLIRRTDRGEVGEEFEYIDLRGPLAAEGLNEEERYANAFAAALLMPADLVRKLKKDHSATELTYLFQVSADAMENRLKNLKLL
jgi:Zn-dependent peptidase ImmA (M78 family)